MKRGWKSTFKKVKLWASMEPTRYRVYAKLLSYILPPDNTELGGCVIRAMSPEEQESRGFLPLSNTPPDLIAGESYTSYLVPVIYADGRLIKSGHVMYADIETHRSNEALGIATAKFDRLTASLELSISDWYERKHGRFYARHCVYQTCKVYKLDSISGEEIEEEVSWGGSVSQMNVPSTETIDDEMQKLMEKILTCDFFIVNKSLGYYLEAKRIMDEGVSLDKVALDLTKSVEILTKIFDGKNFSKKLDAMGKVIGLTQDDKKKILNLWKIRSDQDVAHADLFDRKGYLPSQFPVPNGVMLPSGVFDICAKTILRFFSFFDGVVEVKIRRDTRMGGVNEITRIDNKDLFVFYSPITNRRKLTPLVKKKLASCLGKKPSDIKVIQSKFPNFLYKIKDYKRTDFRGRGMIRIFGRSGI